MFKKVPQKLVGLFVACAALMMTGCGSGEPVDTKIDDVPKYRYSGVLQKADRDSAATDHYLFRKDEPSVPVQSLSFNLNDKEFLGMEVEVNGVAADSDTGSFVLEIQGIKVIGKSDSEQNDEDSENTAEWTVYSDADLGFQISHMDDWEVEKQGAAIVFYAPRMDDEEGLHMIKVVELDAGPEEVVAALAGATDGGPVTPEGYSARRIGKKQYDAYEDDGADGIVYYVPKGDQFYEVSYTATTGAIKDVYRNLFFEMILTFEFFNYGESSDVVSDLPADEIQDSPVQEDVKEESKTSDEDVEATKSEDKSVDGDGDAVDSDEGDDVVESAELIDGYRRFESLPFKFQAQYPKSWYYSGKKGVSGDVQHQYLFSDEPIEDGNELIVLDVLGAPLPGGSRMTVGGKEAVMVTKGDIVELYVERGNGQSYRFVGPAEHKDTMQTMAASVAD